MKSHTLFLAASAIVLATAGLAVAGEPQVRKVIVTTNGDPAPDGMKRRCQIRIEVGGPPAFADIDADHNGSISPDEFDAFHKDHHPPMPEGMTWNGAPDEDDKGCDMPPPGGPDGPGGPAKEHYRIIMMQKGDLDADKDGKVTFSEFSAPMKQHFDDMDTNHDGVLSGDELKNDIPPPPPGGN